MYLAVPFKLSFLNVAFQNTCTKAMSVSHLPTIVNIFMAVTPKLVRGITEEAEEVFELVSDRTRGQTEDFQIKVWGLFLEHCSHSFSGNHFIF